MSNRKNTLEVVEGTNSALWFLMDGAWMMGWDYFAYFMILPVVASGVASIILSEKVAHSMLAMLALNCWILTNVLWMASDLSSYDSFMPVAKFFFAVGALFILLSLMLPGNRRKVLSEFKRFKIK